MHANLRAKLGIVRGDSIHVPCSPHGFSGAHNDESGKVVCAVAVDVDLVVGQSVAIEGIWGVVSVGFTMDIRKSLLFKGSLNVPLEGGGSGADGQLHAIRIASQTSSPHDSK